MMYYLIKHNGEILYNLKHTKIGDRYQFSPRDWL